jgi:GDP-L-fucose synthase
MNILITGASGFLGRHLSIFLQNKGHVVTKLSSKDVDLTNQESCKNIPSLKYDQIYHLAAWTRAGDFCEHHQGDQWIINQQINTNILNWWKINCPTAKMIAFGTSASYAPGFELKEEHYLDGMPLDKYYSYAMSKRMLLIGLQALHYQYEMNYLYIIPSTLYGNNYHKDGRQMHFIYDIINKIMKGKKNKSTVILYGDGYQRRELVYIHDFIFLLYEINKCISNTHLNIGANIDYSIREFAQFCCDIIGFDSSQINYDTNAFVGLKSKILNLDQLKSKVQIKYTSIEEGLLKTINSID